MKICFDLDGVLTEGVYSHPNYRLCRPNADAVRLVKKLYDLGNTIIIHTARWEEDRAITERWLREHDVSYHELILGKPYADVYVEDNAIRFSNESAKLLYELLGDKCE